MSTARLEPRRLQPHRAQRRARTVAAARRPLTLAAVCAVTFAAAFALGHGGGSAAVPHEAPQWAAPVLAAGGAIPATLGSAPPIQIETPPVRVRGAGGQAATGVRTGLRTTLTERLLTEGPATRLPAPVSAPTPQVPSAPVTPGAGGPPSAASPTSKSGPPIAHPGESFDTSG
jgi:hypothetical protein